MRRNSTAALFICGVALMGHSRDKSLIFLIGQNEEGPRAAGPLLLERTPIYWYSGLQPRPCRDCFSCCSVGLRQTGFQFAVQGFQEILGV
ncbi:MAG: hypothetical protein RL525_860 [Bacteroidota bacterium]|jgi:hypothetical protein